MRSVVEAARARPCPARRFLLVFLLACAGAGLGVAGGFALLDRWRMLPAPPFTATACINDKLAFLRGAPLGDRTLLAVGSSATWRNLDVAVLERSLAGARGINAAPCYLHVDQTAFLAGVLLPRMPRVETLLVVLAPRDFEACPPSDTAFLDPHLAGAYLSGLAPAWLVHLVGFRPVWLAKEAWRMRRAPASMQDLVAEDHYGTSVMRRRGSYWPPLTLDPRCHGALARLEEVAAAHGARLVVATLPVMPAWAAAFDPDGRRVEAWTRGLAAALTRPESVLVDGRALAWGDERFADPVHLLHPHHRAFTAFVAAALAARAGS